MTPRKMFARDLTAALSILIGAGISTVLARPPVSETSAPQVFNQTPVQIPMTIPTEEIVTPELPQLQAAPEAPPPQLTRSVQILSPLKKEPEPEAPRQAKRPERAAPVPPAETAERIPTKVIAAEEPTAETSRPIPSIPSPPPVVAVPLTLEVPVVSPAPAARAGLVARISDISLFKRDLLDLTERSGGSIAFQGEDIEIQIAEERHPSLRAELRRLIFKYLAETGPEIRISLATRP
ncbi:hypothetical protein HY522_07505 [bacterium]|nr:hypothetical protein [bacterium]